MPNPDKMIAAVHAYFAAFEAGSADQIAALFAPDATVEDPVGSKPIKGIEAIRAFYKMATDHGTKLMLEGPIRVAQDYAAFPFKVFANVEGKEVQVEVIDIFRFNDADQVVEMRAFFGPVNMLGFD